MNENEYLKIARHEIKINLEEIVQSAARILDNKGRFAMVHRPDRMIEIINMMQNMILNQSVFVLFIQK